MNFEFSEEQHLLRQQAQTFLRDKASPAHVRAILNGEESFDQRRQRGGSVVDRNDNRERRGHGGQR